MDPSFVNFMEQLSKAGPTTVWAIALIVFGWKVFPRLAAFWSAGADRDRAMAETLPRMRESLDQIAQNTSKLDRMDEKINGAHEKLDILLGRR
jgi:hypothetical protein